MDLAFAPEDAAFRVEVRTFLREKLPERLRYKVENGVEQQYEDMLEWHRTLAAKGQGLKKIAKALNRSEESTKDFAKKNKIKVAKKR